MLIFSKLAWPAIVTPPDTFKSPATEVTPDVWVILPATCKSFCATTFPANVAVESNCVVPLTVKLLLGTETVPVPFALNSKSLLLSLVRILFPVILMLSRSNSFA